MPRIIAGVAGGRRLVAPRGRATRPTSDRAREGLFSALGDLEACRFLDLYAGSGAVGLEALSRGARHVLLVERDPAARAAIRVNLEALALPGAVVHPGAVGPLLAGGLLAPGRGYDVVYLDPPYAQDVDADLVALVDHGWLTSQANVVVERSAVGPPPGWPPQFTGQSSRRYGQATLWYGRAP